MKKEFEYFKYFIANSFITKPIFSILFGIIVIYSYFYFGNILILLLLFISSFSFLYCKNSLSITILVIIVLASVFAFLSILVKASVKNNNGLIENQTFCALATKASKNRISLNNFVSNGKFSIETLTMSVSNEEQSSLSINELDIFCIEGNLKFYKTDFGNGFSIENPTIKNKFTYLAEYKNILNNIFISPLDKALGENSALLKAIVLGVQDGLTKEDKETFKSLGLMHLLVASGANIVIVVNLITTSFEYLRKRISINHYLLKFLELLIALSYLLLVGLQGSLTRAFFFFVVLLVTEFSQRKINFAHKVLFATVLMLLIIPGLVFSYSFYLSIFAVFSLHFAGLIVKHYEIQSDFLQNLVISIIVPVLMYIPTSVFFGEINTLALLSNIVLAPAIEALVTIGFIYVVIVSFANFFNLLVLVRHVSNLVSYLIDSINYINKITLNLIKPYFSDFYFKISYEQLLSLLLIITIFYFYYIYFEYREKIEND